MKRFWNWLGQVGTLALGGVVTAGVIALILFIKRRWASETWHAIVRSWHWFGRDTALPHWFFLVLVGCLALVLLRVILITLRRVPPLAPDPRKIATAQRWRKALARHSDAFLAHRANYLKAGSVDQTWVAEYRDLRQETEDTYKPIARDFRKWIRDIEPTYLREFSNEPVWVDVDSGPDESADGLVEKLWLPSSLPGALKFWDGFPQLDAQELFGDRVNWVDSFIERLKNPIKPGIQFPWRYRLRRWFRRRWHKLKGESKPAKAP